MYRAVGEGDVPIFVLPRAGVLQPVLVVTLVIVFARMGAARFGAREGGMGDDHRLIREIGKLQRGDQRETSAFEGTAAALVAPAQSTRTFFRTVSLNAASLRFVHEVSAARPE